MGSRLEAKSNEVRKRIAAHSFSGEEGEEYEGSKFGGFPEYFRRKKIKLQNLDHEIRQASTKPQIFKGVVAHVNGYTQPSLNDLHTMIVEYGGGFIQYLDGKTMATHIIASNLTPKKKEEFRRYRIVKPAWVVDSIQAGKLLPWNNYRVVDEGVGQKVLGFGEDGNIVSQASKYVKGYKEETERSWYTSQLKTNGTQGRELDRAPGVALRGAGAKGAQTQTVTPQEDIEDDEYPLPEITSSIENELDPLPKPEVLHDQPDNLATVPRNLLEVKTTIATPPPSSPVLEAAVEDGVPDGDKPKTAASALQPREGSQEPDYTMAVLRDSEILRAVSPSKLASMTAEEHNALLLSDPKIRKSTVVHPDFLEQYYRESRLHHLSTWKADLKSQLQALAAEKTSTQKLKLKKLPGQRRYIMHVDFDCFFAAVSLKKHPHLVDKPCVVAHGGGSGSEIASCNYPARKYGISNGMWMRRAQEMCSELKILPYDFPAYEDASRQFYDAIMATGGVVQSVSIDEALVDISASCITAGNTDGVKRNEGAVDREQSKADDIAQKLRDEVLNRTGCNVSVGVGGNILLAKVALRKAKPAGQYQLKPEEVLDFIGALEVTKLPGVAWSIGGKLEEIGIKLVKDIRENTKERLISTLGPKTGEKLWDYARGIDRTEVGDQVIRKSVSAEVNWGVRFETNEQVEEFMLGLSGELERRLTKERVKGKQLTMKIMVRARDAPLDPPKHLGHGKCDTYNKSMQLGVSTHDKALIAKESIAMMRGFNFSPGELRGIGVQMQKLEPIKSTSEGAIAEGSQKRLQFKSGASSRPATTVAPPKLEKGISADPIQDDGKSSEKPQRFRDANQPSVRAQVVNASTPTKTKLNTLGTQFALPTQVDPSVLAELPEEIRAKLRRSVKPGTELDDQHAALSEEAVSGPSSRAASPAIALPNQSQLDPAILEALPEDVRAEILGYYRSPGNRKRGEQALLPQSPRKTRTLPPSRQPLKRKRGRPAGLFSGHSRRTHAGSDVSTLTQANFVARANTPGATDAEQEPEEMDAEFLAALPEDIRKEVLDQQRQARLQRTGGIDLSLHQKRKLNKKKANELQGPLDRHITLPPRPPVPSFTGRKLTALPDLRVAIKAWVNEFADEGPYDEDVDALINYLSDVVSTERDMDKAVQVVRWMGWVVDEGAEQMSEDVRIAWEEALTRVNTGVQSAVQARGLGFIPTLD